MENIHALFIFLPYVERPSTPVSFKEQVIFTLSALILFLVLSQLPIYGAQPHHSDPFYHQRLILASNRGTIMELGISPIVSADMFLQLLEGAHIINLSELTRNRKFTKSINKLAAMVLAIVEATALVLSGTYGRSIGTGNGILIIIQLFFGTVLVILLDELLERGYGVGTDDKRSGVGSGISLFICTNICTDMVWRVLSPVTVNTGT